MPPWPRAAPATAELSLAPSQWGQTARGPPSSRRSSLIYRCLSWGQACLPEGPNLSLNSRELGSQPSSSVSAPTTSNRNHRCLSETRYVNFADKVCLQRHPKAFTRLYWLWRETLLQEGFFSGSLKCLFKLRT